MPYGAPQALAPTKDEPGRQRAHFLKTSAAASRMMNRLPQRLAALLRRRDLMKGPWPAAAIRLQKASAQAFPCGGFNGGES